MGRRRPLCSFQREQGHRRWHEASWMQWKSQQLWRSLARPRLRLRSRRRRRAKAQPAITVENPPTAATRRDTATAAHAAHGDTSGEARAGVAWSRHASLKAGLDVLPPLIVIDYSDLADFISLQWKRSVGTGSERVGATFPLLRTEQLPHAKARGPVFAWPLSPVESETSSVQPSRQSHTRSREIVNEPVVSSAASRSTGTLWELPSPETVHPSRP